MAKVLTNEINELSKEDQRVINFKLTWLLDAGYEIPNARKIANDSSIDWHFAVDLRKNCSDEDLCMDILF